ncbi:MAG: TonB-dependent receptor [Prevotella sp.]|nr:TonB-dependent receptor [Prevotella sp.]
MIQMENLKRIAMSLMLLCACMILHAQDLKVSGTVISGEDNEPVIGATVREKGTQRATVTDMDGRFTLTVKQGAVIEISYLGMQTVEMPAAAKMNVTLKSSSKTIDEVVVTGYTAEKKADLTGSVSVVKMTDIADVPTGNVLSSLNGRVAGVNITTDGTPGSTNTSTLVRGTTTINNSSPLYVIDGIMTRDNVGSILSSNDVESIQVLKDASSAAIYGAQAANGVIIITTKHAKKGEVKVDFDASLTAQTFTTNYDLLNARQWGDVYWQAYRNSYGTHPNSMIYGNGETAQLNTTSPYFTGADGRTYTAADTDWLDLMYKTALMQNYSLTMSKGSENGSSSLSVNWIDQDGMLKNTDYQRFNTRLTSDYAFLNNRLRVGESIAVNYWTQHFAQGGIEEQLVAQHPAEPAYDSMGGYGGGYMDVLNDKPNPLRLQNNQKDNVHKYWRVFGNVFMEIEPIKNLTLKSNFGINYYNEFSKTFVPKWTESSRTVDVNELDTYHYHNLNWVWTNTANYNLELGDHHASFLLGMESKKNNYEDLGGYGQGLMSEETDYRYLNAVTNLAQVRGIGGNYSMISYFAKANYAYQSKYLVAATVRRDASSRFGSNHNVGVFPSVSAGWRISSEKFMESSRSWLDDLKLRASWGINGNDEIDNEATYTKYLVSLSNASYNLSGDNQHMASGASKTHTGNPDLKWEQTQQINFGLDATLLNQRLTLSLDYFLKKTTDMLFEPPYAGVIGEGGYSWQNCIDMDNNGFELVLGWRDRLKNGLNYSIDFNASVYHNEMKSLPDAIYYTFGGAMPGKSIVGQPYGSWMGYKTDGVFRTQDEVDAYKQQYDVQIGAPGVGRIKYLDINGDNKINTADQTWLGCDRPKFTAGLNLSASYKGFDLSLFFNGMIRDAWNNSKFYTDLFQLWNGNHSTRLLDAMNAWTEYEKTGVYNCDTPALTALDSNNENRSSEFYIENGSFIKLKTATLGYTLPQSLLSKIHLRRARVYVQGQNLFTITGYTGADPEGLGYTYPLPRTFTFGLSVGL